MGRHRCRPGFGGYAEHGAHQPLPDAVASSRAEGGRHPLVQEHAPQRKLGVQRGEQPALSEPGVGVQPDDLALAASGQVGRRQQPAELFLPPEHRAGVAVGKRGGTSAAIEQGGNGDRPGLALDPQRRQVGPDEAVTGPAPHLGRDPGRAGRSGGHQSRREVDGVAQAAERPALGAAVRAVAQPAGAHPDRQPRGGRLLRQSQQLQRAPAGPGGVVLVRQRCAEYGVQVGTFVADRQL